MRELDGRGIPGAMIATTEFEQAANAQAKSIGFMPAIVWVPHPIQNRTKEELRDIAAGAIDSIWEMISGK